MTTKKGTQKKDEPKPLSCPKCGSLKVQFIYHSQVEGVMNQTFQCVDCEHIFYKSINIV